MKDILFDTPFWLLAGFAIVGIALFVVGNNRTDRALRNLGLGVLGVGVLLFLMSWFVDTDKEKCLKSTRALVRSVQDRDWTQFDKLLSTSVSVRVPVAGTIYKSRDTLHKATETAVEKFGLRNNSVISLSAQDTGDFIKVSLSVLSEGSVGYPLTTTWELEWQDLGQGWQLTDLNAVRIGNQSGPEMEHNFPNVK